MRLPEPPGDRQLEAVGDPGLTRPASRPARPGIRTAESGTVRGAATRTKRFWPMGTASKRPAAGDRTHDGHVELAALEQPEQFAVVAETGHHGQVGRRYPGQDERREELGRRSQPQRRRRRSPGPGCRARSRTASSWSRAEAVSAYSATARPVGSTPRGVRTKSGAPTARSRPASCWLAAGCDNPRRRAPSVTDRAR